MANLTFNSIQIAGGKKEMQPILDILLPIMEWDNRKPDGLTDINDYLNSEFFTDLSLFESLVPLPEGIDFRDFYGTGANPTKKIDGYNYDITNYVENENDRVLHLAVETAWVPCDGFCLQLSNKYGVSVINEYDGDEIGIYMAISGEVIRDDWWSDRAEGVYSLNPNDFNHFYECEVMSQLENGDYDGCTIEEFMEDFKYITNQEHIDEMRDAFNEYYNLVNS
jgi:hypothetical protein